MVKYSPEEKTVAVPQTVPEVPETSTPTEEKPKTEEAGDQPTEDISDPDETKDGISIPMKQLRNGSQTLQSELVNMKDESSENLPLLDK